MELRELEQRPATTCVPETSIRDAAARMRADNVGSLVVVDEHGRLTGIVTDRDIVVRGLAEGLDTAAPVEKVISREVFYLYENADVHAAANEMAAEGIRRVPVVDVEGHLTGVVSFDDLVVFFGDEVARLARAVRKEISRASLP